MKPNLSTLDLIIYVDVAALSVYLYFAGITGEIGIVMLVLAVIFTLTALISFCPPYTMFKFSTLKRQAKQSTRQARSG